MNQSTVFYGVRDVAVILIADDDEIMVELVRFRLEQNGHHVLVASDGQDALTLTRKLMPDLIILDSMMPMLSGPEVLYEIRTDSDTAHIPVLMLTARKGEDDVITALRTGASDYMTKPFVPLELAARVDVLLARSGQAPSHG